MDTNSKVSISSFSEALLARIFSFLYADKSSLFSLCLANKWFNEIASSILYAKICVLTHSDVEALVKLSKRDAEDRPRSALSSSCSERNSGRVYEFEVTALIFPVPNQRSILRSLEQLLPKYRNLRAFTWCPPICDTELTLGVVHLLPQLFDLNRLSIKVPFSLPEIPKTTSKSPSRPAPSLDAIAEEDEDTPLSGPGSDCGGAAPYEYKPLEDDREGTQHLTLPLTYSIPPREMRKLETLVLVSPSNEVLTPLPDILSSLEKPISSLCFEGNCGPVTPGTLTSLRPILQDLEHFGLGVAYSVKYEDLIPFLDGLPKLRKLELFHYHQLYKRTSPMACLKLLKSLVVRHAYTTSRREVVTMCVWIRRLVTSSALEELEIECSDPKEGPPYGPGHGIKCDGLIKHLVARHRATMKFLRMPGTYVGRRAIESLFGNGENGKGCEALEGLEVCVRRQVFDSLTKLIGSATKLRSICLNVVNLRRGVVLAVSDNILQEGSRSLRCVVVNGRGYRGEWMAKLDSDGAMGERPKLRPAFRISEVHEQKLR